MALKRRTFLTMMAAALPAALVTRLLPAAPQPDILILSGPGPAALTVVVRVLAQSLKTGQQVSWVASGPVPALGDMLHVGSPGDGECLLVRNVTVEIENEFSTANMWAMEPPDLKAVMLGPKGFYLS